MRHFLKILLGGKRAAGDPLYEKPVKLSGDSEQDAALSPSKPKRPVVPKPASKAAERPVNVPKPTHRADVEFGGLIERRGRVNRSAVGQERRADTYGDSRRRRGAASGVAGKSFELGRLDSSNEEPDSTGSVLSALDNSAITLADSGAFNAVQEDDRYNPYNKKS